MHVFLLCKHMNFFTVFFSFFFLFQNFCDKLESHSFAIIAQSYFQIMVDANAVIISGLMAPAENFLRVAQNRTLFS